MPEQAHEVPKFWEKKYVVYTLYFILLMALNVASVMSKRLYVWRIFRNAYSHLVHNQNLYAFYPNEYHDSFLYSPSFPILFYPFSALPSLVGYFLWNNLSVLLVPFLIFKLKGLSQKKQAIACYIALIEILTCMQATQSNVMIVALMLLAFLSFENDNYWMAAIAIAIGFYIKIFPIVTASLFLLYPHKFKFVWRLAVAMLVIGLLPLLVISPSSLFGQYQNWVAELILDHEDNAGKISLIGFFQVFTGASGLARLIFQILGVSILGLMYLRVKLFKEYGYRVLFFCALLIWVVVFNHAAEVASYAIAIVGVAIWFVYQPQHKYSGWFIMFFLLVGTILSIDPTPKIITNFIFDHALKAIPFFIILLIILYQMLSQKFIYNNVGSGKPVIQNKL